MQSIFRAYILFSVVGLFSLHPGAAAAFEAKVLDSVVSVLPDWPPAENSSGPASGAPRDPEGTAVAIFRAGYLATNAHVLGRAKTARIRLNDGRLMPVEIIAKDGATDLALLKAPMEFPLLPMAPEPPLGSPVCAVGNQFGLGLSVTCGVVSAIHRTGTGFNPIEDFIQTDAVINPGGSGGALVDHRGRLIGLVSAIFTKSNDSNIGVNFASSSALVLRVLQDLRDHGRVARIRSGLQVRGLTAAQSRQFSGVRVIAVRANSAGSRAGLMIDDVLTQIGDRAVHKPSDVPSALQLFRSGTSIPVQFLRAGQIQETTLKP